MQSVAIAQHEALKLFGTRRGWLSVAAALLVWGVILAFIIRPVARFLSDQGASGLIPSLFGERLQGLAGNGDAAEMVLYSVIAQFVLPVFAVLFSADQMASDRVRGTLRFLLLRCGRFTLLFSRFIAQLLIMVVMVALTCAATLALIALHSPDRALDLLPMAGSLIVPLWLSVMPYVALMALLSVLASSPRQAVVYAVIVSIVLRIAANVIGNRFGLSELAIVLDLDQPGSPLLSVGQTVVFLALAMAVMWRRDL